MTHRRFELIRTYKKSVKSTDMELHHISEFKQQKI